MMNSPDSRLAAIREREADPDVHKQAVERANKITARHDGKKHVALAAQVVRANSPRAKVILLREIAGNLAAAAAGVTACSKGCSHCCKMPVMMSEAEAKAIAEETGAPMSSPRYEIPPKAAMEFDGVACTFLVDGACSIYSSRPYACRVHYVMDRDETLCEIFPGVKIIAPHLNVAACHEAYADAHNTLAMMKMADVRQFFPHGLSKRRRA